MHALEFDNCAFKEWNKKNYHCIVFYEIRGKYQCLFNQGFGPLGRVLEYENKLCLRRFFLELTKYKEKLLDNNTTIQPYKLINKEQS